MVTNRKWRANVPATAAIVTFASGVVTYCYESAVDWFALRSAIHVARGAAALPVTGSASALQPGFPWWVLAVTFTVALSTTIVWALGYVRVRATVFAAVAHWARANARSFGIKAMACRRAAQESPARGGRRAVLYARIAVALNSLSCRLAGIGRTTQGTAVPAAAVGDARGKAPAASVAKAASVGLATIPPRIDSLGAGTPPRRPNPIREGNWMLSGSIELTGT